MSEQNEMSMIDCCELFVESYELTNLPAVKEAERSVLGCDYGATSWTTREQAEQIIDTLSLGPGIQLLDIGAGSGWPGLLLADNGGCDVTLVDLAENALRMARKRANIDGIGDRVNAIAASGATLPLRSDSFDAISHSDVLCCLPEKQEVLKECGRVARVGSQMHFLVIAVRLGLSSSDHKRAIEAGPPFVGAPADYAELLSESGWKMIDRQDVTGEHRRSLVALVDAFETNSALIDALGEEHVSDSLSRRQEQIAAIDAGLLVRETFLAVLPA